MIKRYYKDCHFSIDRMIKKHQKFFEADLKQKCLESIINAKTREMPILHRFDSEEKDQKDNASSIAGVHGDQDDDSESLDPRIQVKFS